MQIKDLVHSPPRTGRTLQRFNEGYRQVVGCIPYRVRNADNKSAKIEDLEILLISSQKSPRMMFPKGGWELDEDLELAAARETIEEAGVIGLLGEKLGEWIFKSKTQEKYHEGTMFPMLVTEELDVWPESTVRNRAWMTINEARERCAYVWMKEALEVFVCQFNLKAKIDEKVVCQLAPQTTIMEERALETLVRECTPLNEEPLEGVVCQLTPPPIIKHKSLESFVREFTPIVGEEGFVCQFPQPIVKHKSMEVFVHFTPRPRMDNDQRLGSCRLDHQLTRLSIGPQAADESC